MLDPNAEFTHLTVPDKAHVLPSPSVTEVAKACEEEVGRHQNADMQVDGELLGPARHVVHQYHQLHPTWGQQ